MVSGGKVSEGHSWQMPPVFLANEQNRKSLTDNEVHDSSGIGIRRFGTLVSRPLRLQACEILSVLLPPSNP